MKGSGIKSERETIITYNEDEPNAQIWTASEVTDRRLRKLGLQVVEDGERHTVFTCPKRQVRFSKPRMMSENQRKVLAERMKLNRPNVANTAAK
jgi:hypothetical protein